MTRLVLEGMRDLAAEGAAPRPDSDPSREGLHLASKVREGIELLGGDLNLQNLILIVDEN